MVETEKEFELLRQRYLAIKEHRFKNDVKELGKEAFEPLLSSVPLPELPALELLSRVNFNDAKTIRLAENLLTFSEAISNEHLQLYTNYIPMDDSAITAGNGTEELFKNYDRLLTDLDKLLETFHVQQKHFNIESATTKTSSNTLPKVPEINIRNVDEDLVATTELLSVDCSMFDINTHYYTSSPINIKRTQ